MDQPWSRPYEVTLREINAAIPEWVNEAPLIYGAYHPGEVFVTATGIKAIDWWGDSGMVMADKQVAWLTMPFSVSAIPEGLCRIDTFAERLRSAGRPIVRTRVPAWWCLFCVESAWWFWRNQRMPERVVEPLLMLRQLQQRLAQPT
jgi:hypothetical protein